MAIKFEDIVINDFPDKYNVNGKKVDCEKGLQAGCKALCCHLRPALSPQDLEEDIEYDEKSPYLIKREKGFCIYLDENSKCKIYEKRPLACREYSCLDDERIPREVRFRLKGIVVGK